MKKLIFLTGFCLIMSGSVFAQTNVGGIIDVNTTWTLFGSPYIVTGQNIIVDAGITLTIEPGVTIKFDTTRSVQVDGTLRAIGTSVQPITFTGNTITPQPGYWGFILMNSASAPYNFTDGTGSILRYCVIEYAGATSAANGALRLDNAAPYINNCTIQNNSKPGVMGYNYTKSLRVDSCTVQNNNGNGVEISSGTALKMNNCTITGNTGAGISSKSQSSIIKNCDITTNYYGINSIGNDSIINNVINNNLSYGVGYFSSDSSNCIISNNNISSNNGFGISYSSLSTNKFISSTCDVSDNSIKNNNGYGISCVLSGYYKPINFSITNNTITGNQGYGISWSIQGYIDTLSICNLSNNTINSNLGNGLYYSFSSSLSVYFTCIINQNIIKNNNGYGISSSSSSSSGYNESTNQITYNEITGNHGFGISYYSSAMGNGGPQHYDYNHSVCQIGNNTITNNYSYGINFYSFFDASRSPYGGNSSIGNINNNTIKYNGSHGIFYFSSGGGWYNDNNCIIKDNTISGNQGYGISDSSGTGTSLKTCELSNNNIMENQGFGIAFSADSCTINNNIINNNQGYGISSSYSFSSNSSTCTIINNQILWNKNQGVLCNFGSNPAGNYSFYRLANNKINGNGGTGVEVLQSANITVDKNIITKNQGTKGAGIYIATCLSDTITNNIISGNIATQEGGGIYMNINENTNVFRNNTLINNKAPNSSAIYYQGSGKLQADNNTIVWNNTTGTSSSRAVYLGTTNQNTHISFQNNNIYNGNCSGGAFYELFAGISNSDSINAINTYWNQPTWSAINNVIWEYLDSSQLGRVLSKPFLLSPDTNSPITPVKNIKKTDAGGGDVLVRWDANLETDIMGYKIYWGTPTGYSFANVKNVGNVTNYILNGVGFSDTITVTAYDNDTTGTDDQVLGHESWFGYEDACNFIITQVNENVTKPNITIFPNPSSGTFTLINTRSKLSSVAMYNILGEKIYLSKIQQPDIFTIDVSSQPEGIYFLKIKDGEMEWVRKIIITQ